MYEQNEHVLHDGEFADDPHPSQPRALFVCGRNTFVLEIICKQSENTSL